MKKLTKKQINQLKPYWKAMEEANDSYLDSLIEIESNMSLHLGIKDLEFFWCDNAISGIGDMNRTIELIHSHELEKEIPVSNLFRKLRNER